MTMKFNFIRTKFDGIEEIEQIELLMEKASAEGWLLHSWQTRPDGGITVLMVQTVQVEAPQPMDISGRQRSARFGTPPAMPLKDPEGGPELRDGKPFVKPKTQDR